METITPRDEQRELCMTNDMKMKELSSEEIQLPIKSMLDEFVVFISKKDFE